MHVSHSRLRGAATRLVAAGGAVGVVAAGLALAPVASASTLNSLTGTPANTSVNGVVQLTATGTGFGNALGACTPSLKVSPPNGAALVSDMNVVSSTSATFNYLPPYAGNYTAIASCLVGDTTVQQTYTFTVSKGQPSASLTLASTMAVGSVQTLTMVMSSVPTQTPTTTTPAQNPQEPGGVVTFFYGATAIGTSKLVQSPAQAQSTASINWTVPAAIGPAALSATYTGDANFNSASASATVTIARANTTVSITAPTSAQVGAPVQLVSRVFPSSATGFVTYFIGSGNSPARLSPNIPIQGEVAVFNWTPTAPGLQTIVAVYNGDAVDNAGQSSVQINVTGSALADVITVDPVGGRPPLNPAVPFTLGNGASVQFITSSFSGTPVTLTASGQCTVNGVVLTANSGSGSCTLTATTPGGRGYSAGSASYPISLVPGTQTAAIKAANSGRINKKAKVTLGASGLTTNAGQVVSWKVPKKSRSVCSIITEGNNVKVRAANKRGTCDVIGSARAVPGQWNAYRVTRTYIVR